MTRRSTWRKFGMIGVVVMAVACLAMPVRAAQTRDRSDEAQEEPLPPPRPTGTDDDRFKPASGKVANSAAGRAGERQNKSSVAGILPTARVETRVANRVQARLRNRIDRYYDPQANAISPFKVAGETSKRQGQAARR